MALALKRHGRFVVLWERVQSSGRRLRKLTGIQVFKARSDPLFPAKTITTRSSVVQSVWYDSNRANDDRLQTGLGARLSNGILLLIMVILITSPFWRFVPWSLTPLDSAVGKFRWFIRALTTHIGVLLFPSITLILLKNLLGQKAGKQWVLSAVLAALCAWQAWACAKGIGAAWAQIADWL